MIKPKINARKSAINKSPKINKPIKQIEIYININN